LVRNGRYTLSNPAPFLYLDGLKRKERSREGLGKIQSSREGFPISLEKVEEHLPERSSKTTQDLMKNGYIR
jgi:hypothetical protein